MEATGVHEIDGQSGVRKELPLDAEDSLHEVRRVKMAVELVSLFCVGDLQIARNRGKRAVIYVRILDQVVDLIQAVVAIRCEDVSRLKAVVKNTPSAADHGFGAARRS